MAEYKTAEQYVVDRLETVEKELEELKITHATEVGRHIKEFEDLRDELNSAYALLDSLRDFITVRPNNYFRNTIYVDNIYEKEYPEIVARIMEYYDIRPEEGDDE